jgi:hypothetical protein
MFAYLKSSNRKAYTPLGWARAFKDETGVSKMVVVVPFLTYVIRR